MLKGWWGEISSPPTELTMRHRIKNFWQLQKIAFLELLAFNHKFLLCDLSTEAEYEDWLIKTIDRRIAENPQIRFELSINAQVDSSTLHQLEAALDRVNELAGWCT